MESFKHSCPCCGQHIEYTVGYCGKQMQCPMCGQTVTFPAIPPRRTGPGLRAKSTERQMAQKLARKLPGALASVRDFQHWNVVGQIAVPFVLVAVLLGAAIFVKNKLGAPSSSSSGDGAPVVQAEPDAWQKTTELTKAEQAVLAAGRFLEQANALLENEQRSRKLLNNSDQLQQKSSDLRVERAQNTVKMARQRFDAADVKYRQLGGTKDLRSQLRKY